MCTFSLFRLLPCLNGILINHKFFLSLFFKINIFLGGNLLLEMYIFCIFKKPNKGKDTTSISCSLKKTKYEYIVYKKIYAYWSLLQCSRWYYCAKNPSVAVKFNLCWPKNIQCVSNQTSVPSRTVCTWMSRKWNESKKTYIHFC